MSKFQLCLSMLSACFLERDNKFESVSGHHFNFSCVSCVWGRSARLISISTYLIRYTWWKQHAAWASKDVDAEDNFRKRSQRLRNHKESG